MLGLVLLLSSSLAQNAESEADQAAIKGLAFLEKSGLAQNCSNQ
jgi:hypothetical protein